MPTRVVQSPHGFFSYVRQLTIDHTKVPSDQTDFPVLVNVTDPTLKTSANGGHVQNANGYDVAFFRDSNLVYTLPWEIDRYTGSSGELIAHVKQPLVSSSVDTNFYLAYSNSTVTTDQSLPPGVWTNNFLAVYHFSDGNTLSMNDSRGIFNATNHGATAIAGQIDGAGQFLSASSQYVDCGKALDPLAITISAWVNPISFPNAYNTVLGRVSTLSADFSVLYVKSTAKLACYCNTVSYDGTGTNTLSAGTWYHLALTYDSSAGLTGYVNGSVDGTAAASGNLLTDASSFLIGQDALTPGRFWNGTIDEARVAQVARSANWIKTEYNNQNSPSTFITMGLEQIFVPTF